MKTTRTSSRKQQHVQLTVRKDVGFRAKSAGFESLDLVHSALPEIDYSEVDPTTQFLNKPVRLPLLISSMTGGYQDAVRINRSLAEVCAERGLAMGVGSQRQAIEQSRFHRSFSVVREVSRDIPVFGNIGGAEVAKLKDAAPVQRLVDLIAADGLAVHLNPLQELLQPEGTPMFRGVLAGIEMLVRSLHVPLLVKEIGAGLSKDVALRLLNAGVTILDVAGAGGTSWAGVEILRRNAGKRKRTPEFVFTEPFWDWGIPTVEALRQVVPLRTQFPGMQIIASGGIVSGLDVAKSIALGASMTGAARPMLLALEHGGKKELLALINGWERQLRGAMFLTGSRTLAELRNRPLTERRI